MLSPAKIFALLTLALLVSGCATKFTVDDGREVNQELLRNIHQFA